MGSHVAEAAARYLGGHDVLDRTVLTDFDLAAAVHDRLPVEAAQAVVDQGYLNPDELYELVIPRRTLAKRRATTGRLTTEESDKLVRVARAMALAVEAFQDDEKASTWLRRRNRALGGRQPIELLATESGARLVEAVLGRIAYGVYS